MNYKAAERFPEPYLERQRIVSEIILLLDAVSPKDASRVWMWLNGMSFKDMATTELSGQHKSSEDIRSRERLIQKEFYQANVGTLARFKIIYDRYLNFKDVASWIK